MRRSNKRQASALRKALQTGLGVASLLMLALGAPALAASAGITASDTDPAPAAAAQMDFLVGDWVIHDAAGKQVGTSHVDAQRLGTMLVELRRVDGGEQLLWWENSERDEGWIQLFVGPKGQVRAFTPKSTPGEWPLVLGGDVVLQNGTPVKFRMTMPKPSEVESSRKLEMSSDGGVSWKTIFDYVYRRPR